MQEQRKEINTLEGIQTADNHAIQELEAALADANTKAAELQAESSAERALDRVKRATTSTTTTTTAAAATTTPPNGTTPPTDLLSKTIFASLVDPSEKQAWALLVRETRRAVSAVLQPVQHAAAVQQQKEQLVASIFLCVASRLVWERCLLLAVHMVVV
jgi:hypothetical protein